MPLLDVVRIPIVAGAAAAAAAQPLVLPALAGNELPDALAVPLMRHASRLQVLYDSSELGGRTQLLVQRVSLRFDGPTGGTPSAHRIARLTLQLGATQVATAGAGSVFAANLSQALATPLRDVRFDFRTDGSIGPGPEPFGGAAGELTFPLPQPVGIAVPPGGALAFELACADNDNWDGTAQLDFVLDPANLQQPGTTKANGRGCPLGVTAPGPVIDTLGAYEPGGSFRVVGHSFAPQSPVAIAWTASLFASPLRFPNTMPICWSYVDPSTTLFTLTALASDGGELGSEPLPIPKRPAPAGAVIYVQSFTPVAPFSSATISNTFGLASSNYRTIQIGAAKTPTIGAWTATSTQGPGATVATEAFFGGLALRLD